MTTATPTETATFTPTPTPTGIPPLGNKFAVMGTASDGDQIVIFPTADTNLPNPTQNTVPGLPAGASPHGVAYFGAASGLVSDFNNSRIFVVDLSNSILTDTISTPNYNGTGTISVAPGSGYALAGSTNILNVIQMPFNASSTITTLTLAGSIQAYETQAIVFNGAGRAFVYHTQGISVLDPPYNAIAFTIPLPYNNGTSGAIAISPDGNTLLTTDWITSNVYIFTAPFSILSTPETLTINTGPGIGFVGVNITSDGTNALVCSSTSSTPELYAISAPFSSSTTVEEIPLPAALSSGQGFEDIGLSPDGMLAILTGGSNTGGAAAFIQAPFTATGATVFAVNIPGGRGAGAVRFQPPNT
jgi:hypothetical protein